MNKISPSNWAWVDLNNADLCKYLIANLLRTKRINDIQSLSDYAARVLEDLKDDTEASKNAKKGWHKQNRIKESNNASSANNSPSQSIATTHVISNKQPIPVMYPHDGRQYPAHMGYSSQSSATAHVISNERPIQVMYLHGRPYPVHMGYSQQAQNPQHIIYPTENETSLEHTNDLSMRPRKFSFEVYFGKPTDRPLYYTNPADLPTCDGEIYSIYGALIGRRVNVTRDWF